jgi:hypothetical protein
MSDLYTHFVEALEKVARTSGAKNSMAEHVSPGATAGMPNIAVSKPTHPNRRAAMKQYKQTTSRARQGNNYLGR